MKIRLVIPKKIRPIAEELNEDRESQSYYSEVEIDVPVYDIIKALKIEINEHTKGEDILAKINELKSNKFNRVQEVKGKRVPNGIEYSIILDAGEEKIEGIIYMNISDLRMGILAIDHQIEKFKEGIFYNYGIGLNELELKQIENYLKSYN